MAREKIDYRENLARLREYTDGQIVLTVSEVARFLKIDRHKVAKLIQSGKLGAVDVSASSKNASWRVSVEALARYIS